MCWVFSLPYQEDKVSMYAPGQNHHRFSDEETGSLDLYAELLKRN